MALAEAIARITPALRSRYAQALLAVAAATTVASLLGLGAEPGVFAPFLVAIAAIALECGTGPALLATGAAAVVTYVGFLAPVLALMFDLEGAWRLTLFRESVFLAAAGAMIALAHRHRRRLDDIGRARRQLLTFLASDRIGLLAVGHDGAIVWGDPTVSSILGQEIDEQIGSPISGLLAEPSAARLVLRRLASGADVENVRVRVCCKNGGTREVLLNSNAFLADARSPDHAVLLALLPVDESQLDRPLDAVSPAA
jgi:PAS domain-containing protein